MRGSAGEVVFASDVCAKTPKVQISVNNFINVSVRSSLHIRKLGVPRLLSLVVEFRSSWFTVAV